MLRKSILVLALTLGLLLVVVLARPTVKPKPSPEPSQIKALAQTTLATPTPPPQIDETLTVNIFETFSYVAEGSPMGLSVGQTHLSPFTDTPTETLSELPGNKPLTYSFFKFGNAADNSYTLASDGELMYLDRNNDENLSNDEGSYSVYRAEIAFDYELIDAQGQSSSKPYQLWYFYNQGPRFYAKCHYAGQVSFGGYYNYQAVAFEGTTPDGLFRDDGLWIDFNGNGSLEAKEHYPDGAILDVANKKFKLVLNYP